jgi:uncharacterized protein (DUF2267 family)
MGEAILPVFDKTIQVTNLWLKALMDRMGEDDRHHAYTALRSTLQALRDRLPVNEAAHLGAQLPMLVRGFYYEGWHPAGTPVKERGKDEFVAHVREAFRGNPQVDAERAVRSVFALLAENVTAGEIQDVKRILPPEIRDLWPA